MSMLRSYTPADALTIGERRVRNDRDLSVPGLHRGRQPPVPVGGVSAASAGARVRRPRRLRRALEQKASVAARRRPRLAGRCHLVWGGARGPRLHARLARRLGHGHPDLLRHLRREPSRAFQRDGRGAVGQRDRQSEILRRHADSDEHSDRRASRSRVCCRGASTIGSGLALTRLDPHCCTRSR